jgi:hypothetical protein
MMRIFRLLFMIPFLYSCQLYGQLNSQDTIMIKCATMRTEGTVFTYADKSVGWQRIGEKLADRKFRGITKQTEYNSITLSMKERRYLRQQIEENKGFTWNDSLIANSRRIKSDSVMKIISEQFRIYRDEINNALLNHDTIALNRIVAKKPWVYGFSKPLYLRDDTICLLYHLAFGDGDSGYDEVSFYKKENNLWTKWIVIGEGEY